MESNKESYLYTLLTINYQQSKPPSFILEEDEESVYVRDPYYSKIQIDLRKIEYVTTVNYISKVDCDGEYYLVERHITSDSTCAISVNDELFVIVMSFEDMCILRDSFYNGKKDLIAMYHLDLEEKNRKPFDILRKPLSLN